MCSIVWWDVLKPNNMGHLKPDKPFHNLHGLSNSKRQPAFISYEICMIRMSHSRSQDFSIMAAISLKNKNQTIVTCKDHTKLGILDTIRDVLFLIGLVPTVTTRRAL